MRLNEYSSSDREVIRFLFARHDWADLYELHLDFGLTPAQVIDIVERLVAANLAELDGVRARLKPAGRTWVLAARDEIFLSTHQEWRLNAGQSFKTARDPQSPYLPDLALVDRKFFVRLALDNKKNDANS